MSENGITYNEAVSILLRKNPAGTFSTFRHMVHMWLVKEHSIHEVGTVLVNGGKTVATLLNREETLARIGRYKAGTPQLKDGNLNYVVRCSPVTAEWLKAQAGIVSIEKQSHAKSSDAPELDE